MLGTMIPPFYNASGGSAPPATNTTTTAFTGGAWTFTKTAEPVTAEDIVTFKMSDDAASYLKIVNASPADNSFVPRLYAYEGDTNTVLEIVAQGAIDTGTNPFLKLSTYSGGTTTRPSFQLAHNSTNLLEVSGLGTWNFTKPYEVGVAAEMARFVMDGYTGDYLSIRNGTTSAAGLPAIFGVNSTTNVALSVLAQGTTDTGANALMRFYARIGASTTPTTRASFLWTVGSASNVMQIGPRGKFSLSPANISSGATGTFVITFPADTGQTASTEIVDFNIGTSPTKQWATGAITTQRHAKFAAPTYSFVGASTITNAATFAIEAAPVAGTNATITNAYALWVQAGMAQFDGGATFGLRANLKSYTVATLPAVGVAGGMVYVSDAAVNPCVAFSNGTNWKRCDNAGTTVV